MVEVEFRNNVEQAMMLTENGLNIFLDIRGLLEELKGLPKTLDYEQTVRELVEKEKAAVESLQQAIVLEKLLIEAQRNEIQKLIDSL